MSEADTCRVNITPALRSGGWEEPPHYIRQEEFFTDGRLLPVGDGEVAVRGQRKFADYILYYQRDFKLAVVEAKEENLPAENGMQQAMEYAQIWASAYLHGITVVYSEDFSHGAVIDGVRFVNPLDEG